MPILSFCLCSQVLLCPFYLYLTCSPVVRGDTMNYCATNSAHCAQFSVVHSISLSLSISLSSNPSNAIQHLFLRLTLLYIFFIVLCLAEIFWHALVFVKHYHLSFDFLLRLTALHICNDNIIEYHRWMIFGALTSSVAR